MVLTRFHVSQLFLYPLGSSASIGNELVRWSNKAVLSVACCASRKHKSLSHLKPRAVKYSTKSTFGNEKCIDQFLFIPHKHLSLHINGDRPR